MFLTLSNVPIAFKHCFPMLFTCLDFRRENAHVWLDSSIDILIESGEKAENENEAISPACDWEEMDKYLYSRHRGFNSVS
jgi:hypothetical protein